MEQNDHHRRCFLGVAATGAAATALSFGLLSEHATAAGIGQTFRPRKLRNGDNRS